MLSYQTSPQSFVQENGKQVQSVMSLVTLLLQNQNQKNKPICSAVWQQTL